MAKWDVLILEYLFLKSEIVSLFIAQIGVFLY